MEKQDARKQTREGLAQRRAEVIRLRTEGVAVMEIVQKTGLSWPAVNQAIKLWQAGGDDALRPDARGRKKGSGRKLTPQQEADLRQCIRRRPHNHGLKDLLWSRATVRQLVKQRTGIDLTERAVGDYLERWGLVIGDAAKKPPKHCTVEVRTWLGAKYADLFQNAKDVDAEIYWVNRQVKLDATLWKLVSKKPIPDELLTNGDGPDDLGDPDDNDDHDDIYKMPNFDKKPTVQRVFVASVTNNQGKQLWMLYFGSFGADNRKKFLRALAKDTARETIYLIRNETKAFAGMGDEWTSANKTKVQLFPPLEDAMVNVKAAKAAKAVD